MNTLRDRKPTDVGKVVREVALRSVLILLALITVGAVGAVIYRCSTTNVTDRREFTGKIVDKRISVYEWREGSSFANTLVIEEENGYRFQFTVTEEMYSRAKVGMWIRRTKREVEFLTEREMNEQSP